MNTRAAGAEGEAAAADYLQEQGFRIRARNFRAGRGEIDLIATDGDTLVFCEVKTWGVLGFEEMGRSVDERKRRRIRDVSAAYLASHPQYERYHVRYDLIFLSRKDDRIEHVRHAFDGE